MRIDCALGDSKPGSDFSVGITVQITQAETLLHLGRKRGDGLVKRIAQILIEKITDNGVSVGIVVPLSHLQRSLLMLLESSPRLLAVQIIHTSVKYAPQQVGLHMQAGYKVLDQHKLENGRYVLTASKSVPAFKAGNVGEENKWVTLYAYMAM